jgi:hypothetical protein
MSERVVNLFLYVEDELIKSLGATAHDFDGNDEQANAFLQNRVAIDAPCAIRYPLPVANIKTWLGVDAGQGMPLETFDYLRRIGKGIWLFEDALQKLNVQQTPLVCMTFIVDGKPVIHSIGHVNPPACPEVVSEQFGGVIKRTDWLATYITPLGLNVHDLLHDDFTEAIKLLYEHKHYVSATKLLVSFVDTVAFLDFGDVVGNYQMWLSKYAKLTPVGVTPSELWEFRNSILHMTNPLSRKVLSGNVLPLAFYIDPTDKNIRIDQNGCTKMFSLEALYEVNIIGSCANRSG